MNQNEGPSRHYATPESLEAELRALPQPEVPVDLEARLLAGIPSRPGGVSNVRRVVLAASFGAIGVAAALLIVISLWPVVQSTRHPPVSPDSIGSTSSEYILAPATRTGLEETKPWNVQPPLSY